MFISKVQKNKREREKAKKKIQRERETEEGEFNCRTLFPFLVLLFELLLAFTFLFYCSTESPEALHEEPEKHLTLESSRPRYNYCHFMHLFISKILLQP